MVVEEVEEEKEDLIDWTSIWKEEKMRQWSQGGDIGVDNTQILVDQEIYKTPITLIKQVTTQTEFANGKVLCQLSN